MMKRILAVVLFCPTIAAAQPAETPATTQPASDDQKTLGVGYKLGNGIGFFGGDVIIHAAPHVTVDLQGAFMPVSVGSQSGTVYGAAPAIQTELFDGGRSTPYGAIGMQWASLTLGTASASGYGAFANIGYEWKWKSGLGLQLGGGVQYLQKLSATDSQSGMTYETGGKLNPNLEFGVRYMFY